MSTTLQQVEASQASAEVVVNENFASLSYAAIFGRRPAATTGLTWGYYGGRWNGTVVADGTVSATAGTSTYVVAARASGAVSASTATTNWANTTDYARLFKLTAGSATITAVEDHRAGPYGLMGGGPGDAGVAAEQVTIEDADTHYTAEDVEGALQEVAERLDALEATPLTLVIACSDETTALTAGSGKVTFRMPYAMTLQAVRASLTTAQSTGSILTVDINDGGASILSTKLTIDNGERTSTTAATAAVISDSALADDAEITIDIDQVGDGTAKGLKVTLKGVAP